MTSAASAPGKLILTGEYAVLFGAPALVMAVDRRATVQLEPCRGPLSTVSSRGPGWEPAEFTFDPGEAVRWRLPAEVSGRYLLFERVLRALTDSGLFRPEAAPPVRTVLDTRPFYHRVDGEAVKLGLGSSAALTVALASALSDWSGVGDRPQPSLEWLQRLLEMHRGFQGGRGSGVDLAASLLGGILEYRLAQDGSVMTAESARLPKELGVVAVWTGRAADTGEILERLSRRLERGDAAIRRALARLGEISEAAVLAARADDGRSLLACVDRSGTAMDELGRAAGIDIVSARHRELTRLAREAGISYKPSGAGVGDMGVGLALDEIALNEFKAAVTDLGLRLFPVTPASDGLR